MKVWAIFCSFFISNYYMKFIKNQLEAYKSSERAKQSLYLLLTNFASIPIGIVISIMLTKMLGAEGFGDYSFIVSIFTFAVLMITLGFFQSGNRVLVLNESKKRAKQYYGAELAILLLMFFLMTVFLAIYSFTDQNLKEKGLSDIFLLLLPLSFVFLADNYIEVLLQADNRIGLLSTHRLLTKLVYAVALIAFFSISLVGKVETLVTIFYLYFLSKLLVFLFILWHLKPTFVSLSKRIKEIWFHNKTFGFNVYIGSVFAVGFTSLSPILIGYFSESNSGVGFYTLALTFSAPLAIIPSTIATSYYKEFSKTPKIPIKLLKVTLGICILALLCIWVILPPFINYFYGDGFKPVAMLNYIVSLGVLIHGFGDIYNRFLGANGQAIALRNSAFIVGAGALPIGLVLIPLFGEYGAAITKLSVSCIYLGIIFWYYLSYTKCKDEV